MKRYCIALCAALAATPALADTAADVEACKAEAEAAASTGGDAVTSAGINAAANMLADLIINRSPAYSAGNAIRQGGTGYANEQRMAKYRQDAAFRSCMSRKAATR